MQLKLIAVFLAVICACSQMYYGSCQASKRSRKAGTEQSGFVSAGHRPESRYGQKYGSHLEPILRRIKASPGQRRQIKKIVEELRPRIEPLRKDYTATREKFLEELSSGESCDSLMTTQLKLDQLDNSIRCEYLIMRLRIGKTLDVKQRRLLDEYRKEQGWEKKN